MYSVLCSTVSSFYYKVFPWLDWKICGQVLIEDKEGGANVSNQEAMEVHRLAGKFFMKRVLNVEAVACTFKPLWKPMGELKIRDSGENVLVFEFDDIMDLERVLE